MFDRRIRSLVAGFGLVLTLAAAAPPAAAEQPGFKPLFNGENLDGWSGDPELWSVEDGAITGRTTKDEPLPYNKFLIRQGKPVENFVLKLEFRLEGNNNTGVQYRSRHLADAGEFVEAGYQADIHPSPKYLGMLYDERGRGIVAQCGQKVVIDRDGNKHVRASLGDPRAIHRNTNLGEWNDYTIIARGNRLVHRINGKTTAIIVDHQNSERELAGNIALQVHRGPPMTAQFRNIRLKRLPSGGVIEPGAERHTAEAARLAGPAPRWIWTPEASEGQKAWFRKTFHLDDAPRSAWLTAACDNGMTVWLNGQKLVEGDRWQDPQSADAASALRKGRNVLAVKASNSGGPAGLLARLEITTADGRARHVVTNHDWQVAGSPAKGWRKPDGSLGNNATYATALAALGNGTWAGRVGFVQAVKRSKPIASWQFTGGGEAGWKAESDSNLSAADGALVVRRTGNDPYLVADADAPAEDLVLQLRASAPKRERWQLFWTTRKHPKTSEGRSVKFEVGGEKKGQWGEYKAYFSPDSPLTSLRLDTGASKGTVRIRRIRLSRGKPPEPLATPAEDINVPEGFEVDLLHSVPEEQGSWVSLCFDPEGRLIASDQYGGLYRITPAPAGSGEPTKVEKLDAQIGHAQGLLHAFGSLYVVVNGRAAKGGGLYRLTDTDGDDQYDKQELLQKIPGGTGQEHGPHSIRKGPDGESLYLIGGNMSRIYGPRTSSRVPEVWAEDQLLPRMPDARGHASNVMAPGGSVVKTDPDGQTWQLICSGFRNPYDLAFNRHGELFTYDADMEWDIGLPWYRPTRVCQVVSGGEYGWRNGSGKWPPYYPDSLPATVNIGPGSPTGIVFGYDTNFPQPYRDALFICDWSYGKLYAVHLKPDGASYTGEYEAFATASPLPLTDIVVGPDDGALYFTIGGRRTQSGLYRIRYTGDKNTEPDANAGKTEGSKRARQLRKLRRKLEQYHRQDAPAKAVDKAWPHLDHKDRFIRFAARIAVEHQDVQQWRSRALNETDPRALIQAMVALARHGEPADQSPMIDALGRIEWSGLPKQQKLALLRAYGLSFIRLGDPDSATRRRVIERLNDRYPAGDPELDRELSRLLGYLEAPGVVGKTLRLLEQAPSQEEQIHYAYVLRTVESGWTMDQRRAFFAWFNKKASQHAGGMSFAGYLQNIKKQAVEKLTDKQKKALSETLNAEPKKQQPRPAEAREFVKNWKAEDLLPAIEDGLENRDFERGKRMFGAALCFRCHRFDGRGGSGGPDLTGAAGRFSPEDLLEAIIKPSKEISDQYQNVIITREDGSAVQGRIVNLSGNSLRVSPNPMDPSNLVSVNRNKVASIKPSPVSPMPPGLLNTLNKQEVLDLIAYLLSRGNPDHEMFADD